MGDALDTRRHVQGAPGAEDVDDSLPQPVTTIALPTLCIRFHQLGQPRQILGCGGHHPHLPGILQRLGSESFSGMPSGRARVQKSQRESNRLSGPGQDGHQGIAAVGGPVAALTKAVELVEKLF